MGRTSQLREKARLVLDTVNIGSYQKRCYRKNVVLNFIDILYITKQVPASWYALGKEHIQAAVALWRKQNKSDASIRMYLANLRFFLKSIDHHIDDIDNQKLGLKRAKETPKNPYSPDKHNQISDPLVFFLLSLQTEFGLTLSESFRFNPDLHARDNFIILTRDITNNSKDRAIPVSLEAQRSALDMGSQLLPMNHDPIRRFGYSAVRERYRHEIVRAGLTASVNYRHVYAKNRYALLQIQPPPRAAKSILLDEMGISSLTLWRFLNE